MQSALRRYRGANLEIEAIADRGQYFISVRPMGDRRWFSLETWGRCLGSPTSYVSGESGWDEKIAGSWQLPPQVEYLKHNLDTMNAMCSAARVQGTIQCLAQIPLAQGNSRRPGKRL